MKSTILEVFELGKVAAFKSKQSPDKTTFPELIAGVELEIENIPRGLGYYQEEAGSFWSVVEDRSLAPPGASWEFVSRPAPIGIMLAEMRLLYDKLKITEDNYSDRCSVHIHTNVQDFTQEQLANLALVYPVIEGILFQYVNHHKKKEEQGYCRDTNLYCIPWSQCRMNRNFVEKFFNEPEWFVPDRRGLGHRAWEKYTALNFIPVGSQGTVEWRHMHGTADMEKLSTWINLIGSIMKFSKENEFMDIVKTIKVLNDVSTYQQFFHAVLGNTLPYSEDYRRVMSEGVINAKYSLINWEANKGKTKPKKYESLLAQMDEDGQAPEAQLERTFHIPAQPEPAAVEGAGAEATREWLQMHAADPARREPPPAQPQAPQPARNFAGWDGGTWNHADMLRWVEQARVNHGFARGFQPADGLQPAPAAPAQNREVRRAATARPQPNAPWQNNAPRNPRNR